MINTKPMNVIKVEEKRDQGFCDQCGQPRLLLVLSVTGYKFHIKVCQECLESLCRMIQHDPVNKAPQAVEA